MPHRILIIDDEEDIRTVASLSLETVAGWQVAVAGSGAQGIAEAESFQPEAILLDVMMPGMDGPAALRALCDNPRTAAIPVLMLTAKTQSSEHQRMLELGAKAVLEKPFDPLKLAAQIAGILGWD
jgi:CheY-like chemotaxis protein